jgi:3-phytase
MVRVYSNTYTQTIRFATFNASLNRNSEGQLITDLSTPNNTQAQTVAEIIQRNNPDVLLVNEFDFDAGGEAAQLFQDNYLSVSQNGANPIEYPYFYVAPSNTGIASGFDLNNNATVVTTPGAPGYGDDALGFGNFPGQFGMVIYSKYPIDTENVRTFQNFLWQDMPGALLPDNPNTPEANDWYSPEELEVFRLSSKSHWDIPIEVNGETIHVLASHPTPPTFDGPEDRNGQRNHDEIRFWSDYITPGEGSYIYDDAGDYGGLAPGSSFVIMGDQNADPNDGDSVDNAIGNCSIIL